MVWTDFLIPQGGAEYEVKRADANCVRSQRTVQVGTHALYTQHGYG